MRKIRLIFSRPVEIGDTAFQDMESVDVEVPVVKPEDSFGDYHLVGGIWDKQESVKE